MEKLKLKTVRPFVFDNLFLRDHKDDISINKIRAEAICDYVDSYIENVLMSKAAEQLSGQL